MAKTVDEVLKEKNITPQEMEALKDLIEECRQRERRIDQMVSSLKSNVEKLVNVLELLHKRAELLVRSVDGLNGVLETLYLMSLPKERFHRE